MANANVKLVIYKDKDIKYTVTARLLGAITEEEMGKIIPNKEVHERMYTSGTVDLKSAIEAIDKNARENQNKAKVNKKFMRLIAAIDEIKDESSPILMEVERKQLLITEPINFVSEISNSHLKATMNTVDNSTIILNELKGK